MPDNMLTPNQRNIYIFKYFRFIILLKTWFISETSKIMISQPYTEYEQFSGIYCILLLLYFASILYTCIKSYYNLTSSIIIQ